MDLDDASPHLPLRRGSSAHGRPSRAPSGPRIRTRPLKPSTDTPSTGPPSADGLASPPDSPGVSLTAPTIDAALPHAPFPTPSLTPPLPPTHADAAVQAPNTPPPPPPPPLLLHLPKPTVALPKSVPPTFVAPPPLTVPPTITFNSTPIPWKGLPFEAAQWTFSSSELQEIVSRAIRLSARESFVRLLSLQALEVDIMQETRRLDAERAAAQAKWRFEVGRRTMLVQALNSSAASSVPNGESGGDNPITGLVGQLASSIASCDALLSSILHFSDQQSQIGVLECQHWASALALALRKLNGAYERQGQELKRAQAKVQTLEDELEEAWREAQKMAIEFDDLEQDVAESGTEDEDGSEDLDGCAQSDTVQDARADEDARVYDAYPGLGIEIMRDPDETGTLGDGTIVTNIAVVRGVTATAVASKATLVSSPGSPRFTDKSDTKSSRSVKSTRSRRSTRDGPSHVSRLCAARMRSRTASNASLRLPKALRSAPPTYFSHFDAPPIPALPEDHSFLDMSNEQVRNLPPQRYPEPTLALPTPPHSAGLPPTRVPSIWLETDGGKSTRLNGLDRSHSLQIFSSLKARTPKKTRRSNLVMSLSGSVRSSVGSPVEGGTGSGSSAGMAISMATGTASPTSNSSPVSLPTHALAYFRGPGLSSPSRSIIDTAPRPGSAGARLTTTRDTRTPMPVATPRRSLVSRASSVILRRLSQATTGNRAGGSGGGKAAGVASPLGGRALERWREGEGEVMVIGSPLAESFDAP